MGTARAKTINLLLYEGTLGGVISIEDSSWNSGELYSAPRNTVSDLLDTGACNKYGVYLLLSKDMVYVGQSSDLAKRITQHTIGKDWWESVVILTTKDDSLNHSDIDYLESVLIEKARNANRLDCDNKNKGNPARVDKFRRVFLGQYLEEALFLMQLIGVTVFNEQEPTTKKLAHADSLIKTIDTNTVLAIGKRAKNEAKQFLSAQGITFEKHVSYAVKKTSQDEFWMNPSRAFLSEDWSIILNNNAAMELIVLKIPSGTFSVKENGTGSLLVRGDKPDRLDLNIAVDTLKDRKSDCDFSPFVVTRVKYN